MASEKFSAKQVANLAKEPGTHGDGKGLWLTVGPLGTNGKPKSCSWIYRFMLAGRAREMGLGSFADISLAEARDLAREARKMVKGGIDPIEARRARQLAQRIEAARTMTFRACAEAYIAAHRPDWTNEKHRRAWLKTFLAEKDPYVPSAIGRLPVAAIDEAIVMRILQPLWDQTPATASRVRGRIEAVLDWATASKFRGGDNPARWGGNLKHLLAKPEKLTEDKRLAALPYAEIPDFMAALRQQSSVGARALEFAVLTAGRAGEVFGATWGELGDLDAKVWTVPAKRMKAGVEHRVPLAGRALEILREMLVIRQSDLVFPGRGGHRLSHEAMLRTLRAMGRGDVTAHGFRSSFRDWCGDCTNFPRDVAEAALAHAIGNKVELAYRRESALAKRRQLMLAWDRFCCGTVRGAAKDAVVRPIRAAG